MFGFGINVSINVNRMSFIVVILGVSKCYWASLQQTQQQFVAGSKKQRLHGLEADILKIPKTWKLFSQLKIVKSAELGGRLCNSDAQGLAHKVFPLRIKSMCTIYIPHTWLQFGGELSA